MKQIKRFTKSTGFALLFFLIFLSSHLSAQTTITRQITGDETNYPSVTVTVTPDESTASYLVEEDLISGITPIYVSHNGVVDYSIGKLTWGPFYDNQQKTLTYKLIGRSTACHLTGRGYFSTDNYPENGSKTNISGDKLVTVVAAISHSITQLEPDVTYQVTTQHYYNNASDGIITIELLLFNALRDNMIGIRYYGGTGWVAIAKDVPYATPTAWNIPQIDITSVSSTPLTDPNGPGGVQTTWIFKLSDASPWVVDCESICLGTFNRMTAGDYGPYCDLSNLNYTEGSAKTFKSKRGIYVWREGDNIVSSFVADFQDEIDFFSFCAAPKGNGDNKIEAIYLAFHETDMTGAEQEAVQRFIAEAKSRDFEVHYIAGIPEWSYLTERVYGAAHINKVFTYNQQSLAEEQFNSIQFDIEPHAIDTDNEGGVEPPVWAEYIQNVDYFQSVVDSNNSSTGLNIPFGINIASFWHEDYVPSDSYTGPGYEQVINIVDQISIMNYATHYGAIFTCRDEIEYAASLSKPIDVVYETFNTYPTESYWFVGNQALERIINCIEYSYVDPSSANYYSLFGNNIIHYYEAELEYFPDTTKIKRSYRQLRPEFLADPEPLIPEYNTAPVCYVISPGTGEEIYSNTLKVNYEVYDDNDSVPITVSVYLVNSSQTSVYLGSQQIYVDSSTNKYEGFFSADISSFAKSSGYKIKITAEESMGLSGFDTSNYGFDLKETLFIEDYDAYTLGVDPNTVSNWQVFGLEHTDRYVIGDAQEKYLDIIFNSPSGGVPPAWVSFGLTQSAGWNPKKDFSSATIQFDISSDLASAVDDVIAVQITAICNQTSTLKTFRNTDANLLTVPASSSGWVTLSIDASDLTYNESWWATPDLSQVEKIEILFLQTATDFVASGNVYIDNFMATDNEN